MMLQILRWLRGYVCFTVVGKFPERFINIVTSSRLPIWNTYRDGDNLSAVMYASDYLSIRPYARKSRVKLRHNSKQGMPFYIQRYKNRIGVLIGAVLFVAIIATMSCFVWTVDVVGLETISYCDLMSELNKNGLCVGTFKPTANYKNITNKTMINIDKIGWMSINVLGTHASVEIKEKSLSPQVDDITVPCNIKAKCDGVIRSIETRSGVAYFKAGSAVVKDQLVVSGVVEDSLGGVTLVRANARIIAATTHKKSFSIKSQLPVYRFKAPVARYNIDVIGFDVNLSTGFAYGTSSADRYTSNAVSLFDTVLPVCVKSDRVYEKELVNKSVDPQTAQKILQKRSALYCCFSLSDCSIKEINESFSQDSDGYTLDISCSCEEDIAEQHDIGVDNIKFEAPPETQPKEQK